MTRFRSAPVPDPDAPLVESGGPVLLAGGAISEQNLTVLRDLSRLLGPGTPLVAADGGAGLALSAGLHPDIVIGDLDSLTDEHRAQLAPDRLHHISEQETTDFDKALRRIAAPVVLGAGFHGARVDHQLAAFTVLARHPDRPCILVGPEDIACLCPPQLDQAVTPGDWVSLFPLAEVTGRSVGLEWPIDGLSFRPDDRVGTSNRACADRIELRIDRPAMLLIQPRRALRPLLSALLTPAAQWPARAG
ncbi:thiamine diphosphokinase [Pseudooceanicola sp. C21-150M6]|uniref:thiamine diphosphokinase n=1 Tax=Pseudooceanicola sp. C21-150M6 TaxID=3434355 RepID=UPI003D7F7EDB